MKKINAFTGEIKDGVIQVYSHNSAKLEEPTKTKKIGKLKKDIKVKDNREDDYIV